MSRVWLHDPPTNNPRKGQQVTTEQEQPVSDEDTIVILATDEGPVVAPPADEPLVPPKGIGQPVIEVEVELTAREAALLAIDGRIAEATQNLDDSKPVSSDSLIQHSIASSLLALTVLARTEFLDD